MKKYKKQLIAAGCILGFLGLLVSNRWIQAEIDRILADPLSVRIKQKFSRAPIMNIFVRGERKEKVTRITMFDPSRKYELNRVMMKDKEIANFKSAGEMIYDFTGDIPNGEVEFKHDSIGTYGYENFWHNRRHGKSVEFYDNGNVKKEKVYKQGKLIFVKEYFYDGALRMVADYHDALIYTKNKEAGRGKIYYRDGVLMYEWNITNLDKRRYAKSYNIKGELMDTKYFDDDGKVIPKR